MKQRRRIAGSGAFGLVLVLSTALLRAHGGSPYPVVSDRPAGQYTISVWADPDATDDGDPDGRFWITIGSGREGRAIPRDLRATLSIRPLDRPGGVVSATAAAVNGDAAQQFAALVMDHEGPYGVRVSVDSALGHADLDTSVDATYDARPARWLLLVYAMPFVLVGLLWGKLLIRRRSRATR